VCLAGQVRREKELKNVRDYKIPKIPSKRFKNRVKKLFSPLPHLACVEELFFSSAPFYVPSDFKSVLKTIAPSRNNVLSKLRIVLRTYFLQ